MSTHRLIPLFALAILASACSTPHTRISGDPKLFASFPPETQEMIRAGEVEIGFTEEMVQMALGKPNRRMRQTTADGESVAWVYDRRGSRFSVGVGGGMARGGGGGIYSGGVGVGTGGPVRAEERMRVVFVDGKVTAVHRTE